METPDLHAALARLHAELSSAPHSSRLESLAVGFEAGHPALAASLREIVDALTRIGA